jgi:hypothetical protein
MIDRSNASCHLYVHAVEHAEVIFGLEFDDDEGVDSDGVVLFSLNSLRSEKLRGAGARAGAGDRGRWHWHWH